MEGRHSRSEKLDIRKHEANRLDFQEHKLVLPEETGGMKSSTGDTN